MNRNEAISLVSSQSSYNDLVEAYNCLLVEKANLDFRFTKFLDENDKYLTEDDLGNDTWKQYKTMLKEYDTIGRYITTSKYFLATNVRKR